MIPSHPGPPRSFGLFLHLKSGAFGFRLEVRSSHIAPPQIGQAGIPGAGGVMVVLTAALGAAAAVPVVAVRGGQTTPSHPASLHLKSGALGLRLPTRLSHIAPSHFGQSGTAVAVASAGWFSVMTMSAAEESRPVPRPDVRADVLIFHESKFSES